MKKVDLVKVFIASPSDVDMERKELEKIITEWNKEYTDDKGVCLMPIKWENDSTASYRPFTSGQTIINQQLLNNADILIALFYKKLGTPINNYESGTVSEIEEFFDKNNGYIGVFFKDPSPLTADEAREFNRLLEYKEKIQNRGLYREYTSLNIKRFLTAEIKNLKANNEGINSHQKQSKAITFDELWNDDIAVSKNLINIIKYFDEQNKIVKTNLKTVSGKRYIYNLDAAKHPEGNEFKNPQKIFLENLNQSVYLEANFSKYQGKKVCERLFNELS